MYEIPALLRKELLLEWKQKYALNGLLLYVASMVIVVILAFLDKTQTVALSSKSWCIIFWLIQLFVAVNAVAKSFMSESEGQMMYMYGLVSPSTLMIAKTIYNFLLLCFTGLISFFLYNLMTKVEIVNLPLFFAALFTGALAFAANLTLVSAIASKAENKNTLLAVLGFPLTVPILLTLTRLTEQTLTGVGFPEMSSRFYVLWGISGILIAISVILFPFVWKE